jgi:transposase-like protein
MTEAKKRRRYDEDFKRDAVRKLLESGQPATAVALAIGVDRTNLQKWKKRFSSEITRTTASPNGSIGPDEIVSLRKEFETMKETVNLLRSIVKRYLERTVSLE